MIDSPWRRALERVIAEMNHALSLGALWNPAEFDSKDAILHWRDQLSFLLGEIPQEAEIDNALRYAVALVRDRITVEAPANAAIIAKYVDQLEQLRAALTASQAPDPTTDEEPR